MKLFSKISIVLFIILSISTVSSQQFIAPEELNVLLGTWKGTLTYTNYSDGTPFSMPAELEVKKGKNKYELALFTSYPKEPNANSKGSIKVSKDGTKVNKESITAKTTLANGDIEVTTEHQGKDDRKKALIKNVYVFGKASLIIRKEVKFENTDTWLTRNEYKYER